MIRVALTGATGFIGRRLLAHLAPGNPGAAVLAQDLALRVHSRRPLPPGPRPAQADLVSGDLTQPDTWQALLHGADAVFHIAGAVRGRNAEDFAINHRSVDALVAAANALAAPPPIMLVSSLAARRPELSDYAHSKHLAETAFARLRAPVGCVLRPPAVYGPGDVEMLPLLRAMAAGIGAYPGDLDARVSLIHVDDLCRLMLAWLGLPPRDAPCAGVTLEPDDGKTHGYAWRDLHAAVAAVSGRPVRPVRLSRGLLNAVATLLATVGRIGGPAPMLSRGKVRELTAPEWVCSPMPVPVGDWRPTVSLDTGLRALLSRPASDRIQP